MTDSTLCSYHLSHTFTPCFLHMDQWMFKDTLSCLLLCSFCANILQSLTICRTFSTCVPHSLHLFEKSLWKIVLSWCLRLAPVLLTTSFLFHVSNFDFWPSAMIFLIFYHLYPFQTDHAVSFFLIGPFFLVLFCCCSLFYLQFYLFLIFLTLLPTTFSNSSLLFIR